MVIIPFNSAEADLQTAGGKGANLARLARGGFPVPPGFIVSTDAYRSFVSANHLTGTITACITALPADDAAKLENASTRIRAAFSAGKMPAETEAAIGAAYASLGGMPVAVRSSATAEDLPDLSFAGQQDTFLNLIGVDEVLKAVIDCWSSLWTGRAIGYRIRNNIDHAETRLAVVVQELVQADTSGVLFTANPLTGLLSESVIEATFGLGEALVSGQVEPDHFVIDAQSGAINSQTLGAKRITTRSKSGGGVEEVEEDGGGRQTLSDNQLQQLVALGQQVQKEYGAPQDIEWAFADGKLYLLQSRAITSLFPVPEVSFDPLIIWISFGAVQGLVGPITPLGRDIIKYLVADAGKLFGLRMDLQKVRVFGSAGERIWIKISDMMRNPIGRIMFSGLSVVEPSAVQILLALAADPHMGAGKGRLKLSTLGRLLGFLLPTLGWLVRNVVYPDDALARFDATIDDALDSAQIARAADRFGRLAATTAFMRDHVAHAFRFLVPLFLPSIVPSMIALNMLTKRAREDRGLALEVTRGLPGNVTTEMDMALWEAATTLRADGESSRAFGESDAQTLASQYLGGALPAAAQSAIAHFMDRYGMRGVGEIDFGQPRWREDPTPVMHTLQSYLKIDAEFAPDVLFMRGEQAANSAIDKLAAKARRQRPGWLQEKLVRAAARRVRLLMGVRESPKFYIIRMMGIARRALLDVGKEFVEAGTLDRPDDLVFLTLAELEALARSEPRDWKSLVAERRLAYERELRRKQVPRVLVSDGRAFYEGLGAETDSEGVITGSPVSPGVVKGIVHVVIDPRGIQLAPGEILVCPGTDPAWTPLFMTAGGLVTEVGGMMTHGSVVAREYGIPAVVGVHRATERFANGQTIQVDGTTGKIVVIGG